MASTLMPTVSCVARVNCSSAFSGPTSRRARVNPMTKMNGSKKAKVIAARSRKNIRVSFEASNSAWRRTVCMTG